MKKVSIVKLICLLISIAPLQLHSRALVNPEPSTKKVFSIDTATELNEFIKTGNVVVDFHGESWCGPCRMFAPIFEKVAASTSNVVFVKVDVDKFKPQDLRGVPTIVFYKDGKKILSKSGALSESQFRNLIKTTFAL